MPVHHSEPKYQVGDNLTLKSQLFAMKVCAPTGWGSKHGGPVTLQVIEVTSQTCFGGTQHHYTCRPVYPNNFDTKYTQFNECELEPAQTERVEYK